jgi:glycosyltransferase involved in cell wall biosynthesis
MPVRNEEAYLERSLGSVLRQDYPEDRLEVIVADGRSTDGSRRLVETLAENPGQDRNPGPAVRWVDNPKRIAPTGLNAAIAVARGDIVVRVDGHCEIAPDYVRRCVEHLRDGELAGVGGPIETVGESPRAEAIAVAMSSSFGVGGSPFRTASLGGTGDPQPRWVDTIAFGAYPRSVLKAAGPFDEELVRNQDDEYNYRLRKAGGRLLLAPNVRSRYYSRATLRSLWRQYFQYGFWKVRVLQKHPRQMSWRQFVPPAFVGGLGIALALALLSPWQGPLLAVAGAYVAANGLATLLTAARRGWRFLPWLPLLFAILHLGYGSGFLLGLVRFAPRWLRKEGS